jgi:D-sedoheptulose 7-phosphate isomerase
MDEIVENLIVESIEESIQAVEQLKLPKNVSFIAAAAELLSQAFREGRKLIVAGNGGSLCDASHFAEELTGFFRQARPALPAISLAEPGHLSCVGNDIGYEWVFSRGIEAYGKPGDVFAGLTTSGNSANIVRAFETAKKLGLKTIAFLGKNGGKLKGVADLELVIEGFHTSDRIQEAHMSAIHIIIQALEHQLFPSTPLEKVLLKN